MAFLGDAIKDGLADIPVLGNVGNLLGGVVGGLTNLGEGSSAGTGVSGLLTDVSSTLTSTTDGVPLLEQVGDLVSDLVGSGQGELLPTPLGLADVTDQLGSLIADNVPQDIPVVSDVAGLLSGLLGQVPAQATDSAVAFSGSDLSMAASLISGEEFSGILGQINQIDAALFGVTEQLPFDASSVLSSDLLDVASLAAPINSAFSLSEPVMVQNADFS